MPERFYHRSPAVDETTVGERVVLYHRVSGSAIVLNPTASMLWEQLEHGRRRADLVSFLRERFPSVSESQVDSDVQSCLDDLSRHQLVGTDSSAGTVTP